MISRRSILHVIPAWPMLLFLCAGRCAGIDRYLHPGFAVVWPPPPQEVRGSEFQPISPQQASWFAVEHLKETGVRDVAICEVRWIGAPLGGHLVDGQGTLSLNDCVYTVFRMGIRDGTDQVDGTNAAGEKFAFIALGKNAAGETEWFPHPGPDSNTAHGETASDDLLSYEFLLDREQFVRLADRYQ